MISVLAIFTCNLKISIFFILSMLTYFLLGEPIHYVKSVRIQSYSGPHFPVFGLNMERYGVSLPIQSKCREMLTRITPNMDTFHGVIPSIYLLKSNTGNNRTVYQICSKLTIKTRERQHRHCSSPHAFHFGKIDSTFYLIFRIAWNFLIKFWLSDHGFNMYIHVCIPMRQIWNICTCENWAHLLRHTIYKFPGMI